MIGHTKAQQFWFYMCDDGIPTLQYELLCTMQGFSPPAGLLVWCINKVNNTMLPNGKPKPCKPIPMKNVEDIMKGMSHFIRYWDIYGKQIILVIIVPPNENWIGYWTHFCVALTDLYQDSPFTLT